MLTIHRGLKPKGEKNIMFENSQRTSDQKALYFMNLKVVKTY